MAGPSVMVKVLADLTRFGKSANDAGKAAEGVASRAHGAFSTMLGALNRTGVLGPFGEALSGIDEAIGSIVEHGKKIGPAMIGAGGAIAGVGALLSTIGSKDQAAHQQLQASIEATGASYDDYAEKIEAAIKHQEKFGDTANQTQDALRVLTQATGSPTKALELLGEATDLAAAKHTSLVDASTKLGKVYNGNTKLLKEFGISVTKAGDATKDVAKATTAAQRADENLKNAKQKLADIEAIDAGKKHLTVTEAIRLRDAQQKVSAATAAARDAHARLLTAQDNARESAKHQGDAVTELGDKLKGQASASADTFTGKLEGIKAKLEDSAATMGQKYGPALQTIGLAVVALGTVWTTIGPIIAGMELSTLWPILLIVAAVAALIAIAYVIYRNWGTIWAAIKAAVQAVWDWIRKNWPLLLGILLGPVALAVIEIIKHWDQIKAAAKAALDYIKQVWQTIVAFFSGIAGQVARIAEGIFTGIRTAASSAVGWVKDRFNDMVTFVSGLPGRMAGIFSGMWDGIWSAFAGVLRLIQNGWNALHFKMPSFDTHIPGIGKIGGFDVGVPPIHIPGLATGGLITAAGVAYLHAGEQVVPAGRTGPAVVVENANFSSELDIETFTRRMAWALKTAAV